MELKLLNNRPSYGGQAVIEGVMMKGEEVIATAVRKSNDEIVVQKRVVKPWSKRFPILKKPFFRGALALVEAMVIGIQALNFSASQFAEEEDIELGTRDMVLMMAMALGLTVLLFIVVPAYAIRFVQARIQSNFLLNLVEGLIKISIFLAYIVAISRLSEIRRVFEYHGAEHKTINAFEDGQELNVEAVRRYSPIHTRCGTNFILIVLFVSVFLFSFFGRPPFLERVAIHIAILPLVAGVSYEIIKQASKKDAFFLIKWIASPGLWLQRLTTREPDDSQIEVAIRALREVLPVTTAEVLPLVTTQTKGSSL